MPESWEEEVPLPYLVFVRKDRTVATVEITRDPTRIGSRKDNELVIDQPGVRSFHAEIVRGDDGWYLTDCRSTNLVFIDGNSIQRIRLRDQTVFALGRHAQVLYLESLRDETIQAFARRSPERPQLTGTPLLTRSTSFPPSTQAPSGPGTSTRTLQELESLIEVCASLNSSLDLDEVLSSVIEKALALTGADRGFIMLMENGTLVPRVARNMDRQRLETDTNAFSRSFASRAIEAGHALAAADVSSLPQYTSESIIEQQIRSIMCAPLKIKEDPIGCLYVDLKRPVQRISEANLSFFTALANQAAIAIHNARMAESLRAHRTSLERSNKKLEKRLGELEFLFQLSRSINLGHDLKTVLKQCLKKTLKLLSGDLAALQLIDGKDPALSTKLIVPASGFRPEPLLLHELKRLSVGVVNNKKPALTRLNWPRNDPQTAGGVFAEETQVLSAPLIFDDRCLGAINLVNGRPSDPYEESDQNLLCSVANLAALSIEKFKAYQQRLLQEKLNEEIENARKIQELLLPRRKPQVEGFEFAAKITLTNRVGGDYYDFIEIDEGRLALVLADVAGHDIGAAIVMAMGRNLVRTLLRMSGDGTAHGIESSPAALLSKMNPILLEDTEGQRFISMFLGIIDRRKRTLTYSNAGGPNPLILKKAELKSSDLTAGGVPLGLFQEFDYEEETVLLEPDTRLLFFSDGLIEAQAPGSVFFGVERVKALFEKGEDVSPQRTVDTIYEAAVAFTGEGKLQDDLTLIAMKVSLKAQE